MEFPKKPETYYLVRDEIERLVKEKSMDRERFHEFSKYGWQEIVKKFLSAFIDLEMHKSADLSYCWLHFRDGLRSSEAVLKKNDGYFYEVSKLIPDEDRNKKLFLILSEGWVYEGYAREIFEVLGELFYLEDAYILSPKFDWVICHCDDGKSSVLYKV